MPQTTRQRVVSCLRGNLLTLMTIVGVLSGVAFGMILRYAKEDRWKPREIMYVSFVGDIFLQMLKALILPLIVSSIVSAIGCLDLSVSGKIGGRAIIYYLCTTVSAVILGMILSVSIHPGSGDASSIHKAGSSRNVTTADTLMDLARNLFPPNLVQAAIQQYQTILIPPSDEDIQEKNLTIHDWPISHKYETGMNIMGLVMFGVVLGIALSKLGAPAKPLLDFFMALETTMMLLTRWVIWLSPIGVFFLISGKMLEMESFEVIVGQLGMYFMTVMLGLFLHGFVVTPLYFSLITKKLPFKFILNMSQALFTAFGTASSNATLPVSLRLLEEKNGVDPKVSRFVMPIGATINMDGTALYEAVAAVFISQVRGISLGIGKLLAVSVTATMASIGAAGIPQAGLVTMVMVLDTVGLPAEDVTLIIAVDWLLDRFRTTINVLGDALGAGIVNHMCRKELEKMNRQSVVDAEKQDPQNGKLSGEEVEWNTTAM